MGMTYSELLQRRWAYRERLLSDATRLLRIRRGAAEPDEVADQLEASIQVRLAFLGAIDQAVAASRG